MNSRGLTTWRAALLVPALGAVLLSGCSDSDVSDEAASSGERGQLPDSAGDLRLFAVECAERPEDDQQVCLDNAEAERPLLDAAADNLSEAHAGADAVAETYVSADFEQIVRVYAVADSTTRLWSAESDASAERASLAHPMEWVEEADGVQCIVRTLTTVPEGETWTEDNAIPTYCQATDEGRTVILRPAPNSAVTDALDWTRQAFEGLS